MPRKLTTADGKRYSLSARTTLSLNVALKAAAEASGRSVSQEIEHRLEMSFAEDRMRAIAREEIRAALSPLVPGARSVLVTENGPVDYDLAMLDHLVPRPSPVPPPQVPCRPSNWIV